ncbi:MAG: hypothetical protein ABR976_20210 [Terracidiphilus sp.]|jgi:hypothetical protein
MTIPFEVFKERMLADPEVKREYDALEAEFAISSELIRARLRAGTCDKEGQSVPAGVTVPTGKPDKMTLDDTSHIS